MRFVGSLRIACVALALFGSAPALPQVAAERVQPRTVGADRGTVGTAANFADGFAPAIPATGDARCYHFDNNDRTIRHHDRTFWKRQSFSYAFHAALPRSGTGNCHLGRAQDRKADQSKQAREFA